MKKDPHSIDWVFCNIDLHLQKQTFGDSFFFIHHPTHQITTSKQYWITNTKQACMGSDAICVPYLLLLLPSGFDLITEPEVLIGVWSRAHPVCDRAALSVDREITTRGSGKVACKGDPPSMALFTWKQAMKLSKVKSIKMNKIIAQPFGEYAVVTNIFYDLIHQESFSKFSCVLYWSNICYLHDKSFLHTV